MATHPWRRRILPLLLPGLLFAAPVLSGDYARTRIRPCQAASSSLTHAVADHARPLHFAKLDVRSSSVVVMDAADSSVLYSKQAQRAVPIASITKLMTALVVLDAGQPLDEMIELTAADRRLERSSASRLAVGSKLSRGDLLHLALMSSENRAAHAVARAYPGGLLGLRPGHECQGARARHENRPLYRSDGPVERQRFQCGRPREARGGGGGGSDHPHLLHECQPYALPSASTCSSSATPTPWLQKTDWDIMVQKTGYTSDAGQCLVMKTVIRERPVLIVLLNSFGKYTRVADARRIRKWMEAGEQGQLAQVQ